MEPAIRKAFSKDFNGLVELEIRFQGFFRTIYFYTYLLNYYKNTEKYSEISDSVIYEKDIRRIDDSYYVKKSLYKGNKEHYKISVDSEEILDEVDSNSLVEKIRRKRDRVKINLGENVYLCLTKINNIEYEIEVEVEILSEEETDIKVKNFFRVFDTFYEKICEEYLEVFGQFLSFYNKNSRTPKGLLDDFVLARPRNFKLRDFTTFPEFPNNGLDSGYTITVKGDGKLTIVFILKGKIMCICRPTEKYFEILTTSLKGYGNYTTIFVGEHTSHVFTPFDILYDTRSPSIGKKNHLERLLFAQDCGENINEPLKFYFKRFFEIGKTPESMAKAYEKAIEDAKISPYGNDGFILTPIHTPHNPFRPGIRDRMLGKAHDLCKIKPASELTIDLIASEGKLYAAKNIEFTGTAKLGFDPDINVDWESIPEEGKVIELRPEFEDDIIKMKFNRFRTDKLEPNNIENANGTWDDIAEPLSNDIFLNKDFSRLFKQNNNIKRSLILSFPKNAIIIDIGTGRGGDLYKYLSIEPVKVICVEPDDKNRKELLRRLESFENPSLFEVLGVGGENSSIITETYVKAKKAFPNAETVVASMLSMSFFWKSRKFLDSFLQTLSSIASYSPNAFFGFMTIEGERFMKIFPPNGKIRNEAMKADLDLSEGGVSLKGRVKIMITNSIVRGQREYLVALQDLNPVVEIGDVQEAVIERYLSKNEKVFGQTFVYGTGTIKGNFTLIKMLRDIPFQYRDLNVSLLGNSYYKIDNGRNDVMSNFLTCLADKSLNDDDVEKYTSTFINVLTDIDPRISVKDVKEIYKEDPRELYISSDEKIQANAYLFTLSRGQFQKGRYVKGNIESLKDKVRDGIKNNDWNVYRMIADYLEISFYMVDINKTDDYKSPEIAYTWMSLPRSYLSIIFGFNEDFTIFPIGERDLTGKIVTTFKI